MKSDYKKLPLGDLLKLVRNGLNVKQSEEKIGYPITRIETIARGKIDPERVKYAKLDNNEIRQYQLELGDILFSHINSTEHIGKTAIYEGVPSQLIHGVNLLLLRPKQEIIFPKYLLYYLKSKEIREYFSARCKKAVNQSSLNQQDIKPLKVAVFDLPTQRQIASILEKAESAKKKRQESLRLTNEFIKSTFLDIFGDPISNTKRWEHRKLGEALDVRDGTHDTPKYIAKGIPLITSKNLKDGKIDFDNVFYISQADYEQIIKRSFVETGDILYGMIGTIGSPVIVNTDRKFGIKNVALFKFRDRKVNNYYIKTLFEDDFLTKKLLSEKRGGNQKFVSLNILRNFNVPLPPIELQQKFASLVQKVEALKSKQQTSAKELDNLFNSLMQKAFRGEM